MNNNNIKHIPSKFTSINHRKISPLIIFELSMKKQQTDGVENGLWC